MALFLQCPQLQRKGGHVKIGAWIHTMDDVPLEDQIALASENGLATIRCYHYGYAEQAAPALKRAGMSLLAGMHVDAQALVSDWRSQVRLDELARYHELGVPLEAVCVGNELREGGDEPDKKRFTARLSFGLANVLDTYRRWLDEHGYGTPLTYAMEGIVFDREGRFHEWVWPLVDACDIVSLNAYPMGNRAWFTASCVMLGRETTGCRCLSSGCGALSRRWRKQTSR
jgi:hypothetical protein